MDLIFRFATFSFLISVFSALTRADTLLSPAHCPVGCPIVEQAISETVVSSVYTLSINKSTRFADWVAYRIDKQNFGVERSRYWREDPRLSVDFVVDRKFYKGAYAKLSVDRGHLAPLASFASHVDWKQMNYLSNIVPQNSDNNRKIWKVLEAKVRLLTRGSGIKPYVITGTIYDDEIRKLPAVEHVQHDIPDTLYKVIYTTTRISSVSYVAFMIPQSVYDPELLCEHRVEIGTLRKLAKTTFFPNAKNIFRAPKIVEKIGCDYG